MREEGLIDQVLVLDDDSHDATSAIAASLGVEVVRFVKGFCRRPFKITRGHVEPTGAGRVTELTARPLLAAFYPELAAIRQPLAGEFAARRELLQRTAFCAGYAVEIGLLIAVYTDIGIEAIPQVDLDVRQNRHQPLEDLAAMAPAVLAAVTSRLQRDGRLSDHGGLAHELVERPPLAAER